MEPSGAIRRIQKKLRNVYYSKSKLFCDKRRVPLAKLIIQPTSDSLHNGYIRNNNNKKKPFLHRRPYQNEK
jgi:hypothetical protein